MSKRNKVNPGQYTQAGRLSPDDAARERKAAPQGISNRETPAEEHDERQRHPPRDASSKSTFDVDKGGAPDRVADETQSSGKSGSRSTAQKTAEAKHGNRPHPASEKVDGAFGREPGSHR